MCQCIRVEGPLGQGIKQLAMGHVLGREQVYLRLPKKSLDPLDRLGVESPVPPQLAKEVKPLLGLFHNGVYVIVPLLFLGDGGAQKPEGLHCSHSAVHEGK